MVLQATYLNGCVVFQVIEHNKRELVHNYLVSRTSQVVWCKAAFWARCYSYYFSMKLVVFLLTIAVFAILYADDVKLYTTLQINEDCTELQQQLDALYTHGQTHSNYQYLIRNVALCK